MTGLVILGKSKTCVTGFTFYYSDGSIKKVGDDHLGATSLLNTNNPDSWLTVHSYGGFIIDILKICKS